jgi:ABC-type branched-subunit amino acid transport system permease subunit
MSYKKGNVIITILSLFFILFPFICAVAGSTVHLATEILIFSIFALGYNILLGYTGSLSFGHAAFFGIASYVVGFSQKFILDSAWVAIFLGMMVAGAISFGIINLIIRKHGIYFALLTMAFGQVFYFLVYRFTAITGGENGLSGIKPPIFEIPGLLIVNFADGLNYYYLVLIFLSPTMFIIWRIINSPFGKIIRGIKENEKRVEALGYDVKKYRVISFVLSSIFSGLAGSLYAILLRFAFPQTLHWGTSGEIVMMTLVGGMGNFFGPILGTGIFLLLRDTISSFTERWLIIVGSIFIVFVMVSPEGILGIFAGEKQKKIKEFFCLLAKGKTKINDYGK